MPTIDLRFDSDPRWQRSREISSIKNDADFEEMRSLFETAGGLDHPLWLARMATAYAQSTHKYSDIETAHSLLVRAVTLVNPTDAREDEIDGYCKSCYALGFYWHYGSFGRVDLIKAISWYERAFEAGLASAGYQMFHIFHADKRFYSDQIFIDRACKVLRILINAGEWDAYLLLTRVYARSNPELCVERYKSYLNERPEGHHYGETATACLAAREFLGLGCEENPESAWKRVESLPHDPSASATRRFTLRLAVMLKTHRDAGWLDTSGLIRRMASGDYTSAQLHQDIQSGALTVDDNLTGRLEIAHALYRQEHNSAQRWFFPLMYAELKRLGMTLDDLSASCADRLPAYNRPNTRGLPTPGRITPQTEQGFGRYAGLRATREGELIHRFHPAEPRTGPLLFPEDIDVAHILAFGSKTPIWPSVTINHDNWETLGEKVWTPEWLGRTLIGKTLYAVDHLAGRIAYHGEKFQDDHLSREAEALFEEIRSSGGRIEGVAFRTMVHPERIDWRWSFDENGEVTCDFESLAMRVLGASVIIREDGTTDVSAHVNDDQYVGGRMGNCLSRNYNLISSLWPIFERARQLTALISCVNEAAAKGFHPCEAMERMIHEKVSHYTSLGALPLKQRITW